MNLFPFGIRKDSRSTSSLIDSSNDSIRDLLVYGVTILAIIIPIRMFVMTPFIVNGSSMDPTFKHNDYLIVDRLSIRFDDPKRYDIIVFKYPYQPSKYFIKRVVGLPGERITVKSGRVTVYNSESPNGMTVPPPYVDIETEGTIDQTLGNGQYFVLGDNRPASSDSRYWGSLDEKFIVGEPLMRLFPLGKAGLFPGRESRN